MGSNPISRAMKTLIFSARRKDFRVETFASGGPGGQHQNKTQSGVRIIHIASGLSAECRETRNQGQNKKRAFHKLVKKLVNYYCQSDKQPEISSEVVRTYHHVDNRVKDHKSGLISSWKEVIDNRFPDEMIKARRLAILGM